MQVKKFQKRVEDFICESCGAKVRGNGFTNHCPECFVSKHVDIFPGDRKESCGGLMDVTNVELKKGRYILTHTCRKCKAVSHDKFREDENFDSLMNILVELNKKRVN